jgi:hypothetical protein
MVVCPCGRFTTEQQLVAGGRDLLEQRGAEPAAGHGRQPGGRAEQLVQPRAARPPLVSECGRVQALHVWRVGVRVAADHVAARSQLSNGICAQKAGGVKPSRDEEEVSQPAAALERVRDTQCARAAIVERQRNIRTLSEQSGARAGFG